MGLELLTDPSVQIQVCLAVITIDYASEDYNDTDYA